MNRRSAVVLLVEDSPADQEVVKRAIEDGHVKCQLLLADNGQEALKILRRQAPYEDHSRYPSPDIILLDINMPIMDGRETLQCIREDNDLKHIPVIMLTTSARDKDVMDSYRLGVNAYITKPVVEEAFLKAIVQLERFWFDLVVLPADQ